VPGQFRAGHSCSHCLRHYSGGGVFFFIVSLAAALELSPLLPLVVDPLLIMCMLSLARLVPLIIARFVLSDDGATAPPAAVVSVVALLSLLLHAAIATTTATIAMRLMKSSVEIVNP
jgi:hypothetical protein